MKSNAIKNKVLKIKSSEIFLGSNNLSPLWDKDVFVHVNWKMSSKIKELKTFIKTNSSFTSALKSEIVLFLDSFEKNTLDIFFLSPLNKHQGIKKKWSLKEINNFYCFVDYMDKGMINPKAFTKREALLLEATEAYFLGCNSSAKPPIDIFFHLFNHNYKVNVSYLKEIKKKGPDALLYRLYGNLLDNIKNTCIHCYFSYINNEA